MHYQKVLGHFLDFDPESSKTLVSKFVLTQKRSAIAYSVLKNIEFFGRSK